MKSLIAPKTALILGLVLLWPSLTQAGLEFEKKRIEHEASPSETSHTAKFHFKNTGRETVTIQKVLTSCNCTAAELEKTVYEPGESGEIAVTFTYEDRTGRQAKKIQVQTENNPTGYALDLIVEIPRVVTVSPPFHSWEHGMEPRPLPFTINLSKSLGAGIAEVKLENEEDFSGKLEEVEPGVSYRYVVHPKSTQAFTKSTIEITVTIPDAEPKTARAFVLVKPGPPGN